MAEKSLLQKIKEAGSHTLIYGVGSVLQTLLSFVLLPVYTRYYTTEVYGILTLLTLCSTLTGSVFYLGASSALSRSYFDYADENDRKKVISTSLYITLAGAVMQIAFGVLSGGLLSRYLFGTDKYAVAVMIILISSAVAFVNTLLYLILRFQRHSLRVIFVNLISLLVNASLILYFLLILKIGVMAPVLGTCISQVLVLFILFWSVRKCIVKDYSRKEISIQLRFGIPQIIIGLATYVLVWTDSFFINKYLGLNDVGVYGAAYKLGMMIQALFVVPFSQIWAPMRMEYRHDNNATEFTRLIITYYFFIGMAITTVVSIFSRELIMLVTGKAAYFAAFPVISIVMFAYLLYGVVNIIDNGILFSRKVIYHVYIFWSVIAIKVVLCMLFIPRYGYMAAAYITLITYGLMVTLVYVVSNHLHKIEFENFRLFKIMVCGLVAYAIALLLPSEINLFSCLGKISILSASFVFMYLFVLNHREKGKISAILRATRMEDN